MYLKAGHITHIVLLRDELIDADNQRWPLMTPQVYNFMSAEVEDLPTEIFDDDPSLATLFFALSNDKYVYQRSNYSFLNFLGDVSALFDALGTIATVFLSFIIKYGVILDTYLVNSIFRLRKPSPSQSQEKP